MENLTRRYWSLIRVTRYIVTRSRSRPFIHTGRGSWKIWICLRLTVTHNGDFVLSIDMFRASRLCPCSEAQQHESLSIRFVLWLICRYIFKPYLLLSRRVIYETYSILKFLTCMYICYLHYCTCDLKLIDNKIFKKYYYYC